MKLRTILAATALSAVAAPAALGADAADRGRHEVGGVAPSFLELTLTQPKASLSTFPRARTYTTSFDALVTATDDTTLLTLADGDASSGSKLGRMASGSKRLPQPLEARVGRSAFQTLAQSVDPLLTRWNAARLARQDDRPTAPEGDAPRPPAAIASSCSSRFPRRRRKASGRSEKKQGDTRSEAR